ncbi:hypothetical protein L6164_013900 [Bauhinia variegata]|uniref:Uncharacterized protein n=1 Tax=Bauhinia variegata TaxID=167791 RepID=A0ACB9NFX4_BAUVA|nr:hypothetical protein L6164_013900 [Bauhinia variegata]
MGRSPCCLKEGLNRGAWTAHEDKILTEYITVHGEGRWRNLPKRAGLKRCGKSCRLRWLNYLRPDIKRGNISPDEEELIIRLHKLLGNRWSLIAGRLPGRTDNEIKNYWNTNLGKKVKDHPHQTNASSRKAFSVQPDHENKPKNPKTNKAPPMSSKLEAQVVRTKATKCSKIFINPHPPYSSVLHELQNNSKPEKAEADEPLLVNDASAATNNVNVSAGFQMELDKFDDGLLSFSGKEELSSPDLLIDFNMGEICLSDLLNSDFSDVYDFSYSNNNSDELSLSPSTEEPLLFSDELLKDWTQSDFVQSETDLANNLQSFTSFLESAEEGISGEQ